MAQGKEMGQAKCLPCFCPTRVVERCSTTEDRDAHLSDLKTKFEERNYPSELVATHFERAKKKQRKDLIFQDRKKKKGDEKVRLIFTYNQASPPIHTWLRDCK